MVEEHTIPYSWVVWSGGRMDPGFWCVVAPAATRLMRDGLSEREAVLQASTLHRATGVSWDRLTPREVTVLEERVKALELGYSLDSKKGKSMRQYWSKEEYRRKMKMIQRLKHKLKDRLHALDAPYG